MRKLEMTLIVCWAYMHSKGRYLLVLKFKLIFAAVIAESRAKNAVTKCDARWRCGVESRLGIVPPYLLGLAMLTS